MTDNRAIIGLGNSQATLNVYIENIPPLEQYQGLSTIKAMRIDEIGQIAQLTGNHWRKIFNVFAKLCFELSPQQYLSWQHFRDQELLQKHSQQCLYFSPYSSNSCSITHSQTELELKSKTQLNDNVIKAPINLIMGKTYAQKLGYSEQCYWLNESFAINEQQKLIICPYFDYRQLSNIKITQLVALIKQLQKE